MNGASGQPPSSKANGRSGDRRRQPTGVCGARRALAVALLAVVTACAGTSTPHVSLRTLAEAQERYDGKRVVTEGVVRRFIDASGPYFVLEDGRHDQVELVPASRVANDVGNRVEVVGKFEVTETSGRLINADTVRSR